MKKLLYKGTIVLLVIFMMNIFAGCQDTTKSDSTNELFINDIFKGLTLNSTQDDVKNHFKNITPLITTKDGERTKEDTLLFEGVDVLGIKSDVKFLFLKINFGEVKIDSKISEILVTTKDEKFLQKIEDTYKDEFSNIKLSHNEAYTDENMTETVDVSGKSYAFKDFSIISDEAITKYRDLQKESGLGSANEALSIEEFKKEAYLATLSYRNIPEDGYYLKMNFGPLNMMMYFNENTK